MGEGSDQDAFFKVLSFPLQNCGNNLTLDSEPTVSHRSEDDKNHLIQKDEIKKLWKKMFHFAILLRQIKPLQNILFQKILYSWYF